MDFQCKQIESFGNWSGSIYTKWKMRYVYRTTGPTSLKKFLALPEYETLRQQMTWYEMNRPEEFEDVANRIRVRHVKTDKRSRGSNNELGACKFDVLSHVSMSYKTEEDSICVPVANKPYDVKEPCEHERRRISRKRAGHLMTPPRRSHNVLPAETPKQILGEQPIPDDVRALKAEIHLLKSDFSKKKSQLHKTIEELQATALRRKQLIEIMVRWFIHNNIMVDAGESFEDGEERHFLTTFPTAWKEMVAYQKQQMRVERAARQEDDEEEHINVPSLDKRPSAGLIRVSV